MRIDNRLGGFFSRQSSEQFHEARLVRIAHGRFAIWLHPFGMLDPEVVVNLLPELGVRVDLMKHGHWLGERFRRGARRLIQFTAPVSPLCFETNEFHKRPFFRG